MHEEWKDIPGYEGKYKASNLGRIMGLPSASRSKARLLKPNFKKSGYCNVLLCKDGKVKTWRWHRLIASTFIPNPDNKPQVNHKNGNKLDNRVENLEWVTASENCFHSYRILGRKSAGGVARKPVLCKETGITYESVHEAERLTKIARTSITNSIRHSTIGGGYHWQYA